MRRELRRRSRNPSVARGSAEPHQFGTVITEVVRCRSVAYVRHAPGELAALSPVLPFPGGG